MQHFLFSIFDHKAAAFMPIFQFPQAAMARRAFTDIVNDQTSSLHRHPGDYTLYCVGEFDDTAGELFARPSPTLVCQATDVIQES